MTGRWDDVMPDLPDPGPSMPWHFPPDTPQPEDQGRSGPRHADPFARPRQDHAEDEDDEDDLVIRPFLLTGGRTRPAQDGLHVEALIQSRPGTATGALRFEARQIVELCRQPTSVAEVAAALRVPLGVARVLVSDLIADGTVTLVQRRELSVQLIERIRDRVRAL